jgi:histidine triad (HIT) family protein
MNCETCELIKSKNGMLYEDEHIAMMLAPKPAVPGHIILLPKKHAAILEQVPDYVAGSLFDKANKASIAVFETLGAQGTNIIINNGVAAGQTTNHCTLHVLPRQEKDNLNLAWQPRQLPEEEMSTIELKLKEEAKNIGAFEKELQKPKEIMPKEPEKEECEEENHLIRQLKRMP